MSERSVTVRTGLFAWHSAARKLVKSCSPKSACAPSRIRSTSSGRKTQPAASSKRGVLTGSFQIQYSYVRERAEKRA